MNRSEHAPPAPAEVDTTKAHASRIYDWLLGGTTNYAVDRIAGENILRALPGVRQLARANRDFLLRTVRQAAASGITQFLDLGAGIPGADSVHATARAEAGDDARVVYCDYEHVAIAHGKVNLEREDAEGYAGLVHEDFRNVSAVLSHPETTRLIDFAKPVCVLTVALWHFVGDGDDPQGTMREYAAATAPGSWLALTHLTRDGAAEEQQREVDATVAAYAHTANPLFPRDRAEIEALISAGGWTLAEPGLVRPNRWRPTPDTPPEQAVDACCAAGLATR